MTSTPPPPNEPNDPTVGGYPAHPGTPAEGGHPGTPGVDVPQPGSIRLAVRLMWVGAAMSVLGLAVSLLTLDSLKSQLRDSLEESDPNYTESDFDAFFATSIGFAVFLSLLGVGLWLWMAWKNGQGRSWARIVATVFGALNVFSFLATMGLGGATGASIAVSLVSLGLAVTILVLLWRKESSDFYAARSRPQWG